MARDARVVDGGEAEKRVSRRPGAVRAGGIEGADGARRDEDVRRHGEFVEAVGEAGGCRQRPVAGDGQPAGRRGGQGQRGEDAGRIQQAAAGRAAVGEVRPGRRSAPRIGRRKLDAARASVRIGEGRGGRRAGRLMLGEQAPRDTPIEVDAEREGARSAAGRRHRNNRRPHPGDRRRGRRGAGAPRRSANSRHGR